MRSRRRLRLNKTTIRLLQGAAAGHMDYKASCNDGCESTDKPVCSGPTQDTNTQNQC